MSNHIFQSGLFGDNRGLRFYAWLRLRIFYFSGIIMNSKEKETELFKKQFGENFKKYRKAAELTQQEVADILEIDRSLIAKYESGAAVPNLSKLPQICRLFKIDVNDILP